MPVRNIHLNRLQSVTCNDNTSDDKRCPYTPSPIAASGMQLPADTESLSALYIYTKRSARSTSGKTAALFAAAVQPQQDERHPPSRHRRHYAFSATGAEGPAACRGYHRRVLEGQQQTRMAAWSRPASLTEPTARLGDPQLPQQPDIVDRTATVSPVGLPVPVGATVSRCFGSALPAGVPPQLPDADEAPVAVCRPDTRSRRGHGQPPRRCLPAATSRRAGQTAPSPRRWLIYCWPEDRHRGLHSASRQR